MWQFMDYQAKEKLVIWPFPDGDGQPWTHCTGGCPWPSQGLSRAASSVLTWGCSRGRETVLLGVKAYPACTFFTNEQAHSPDSKRLVKEVPAQLSSDPRNRWDACHRPPTLCPFDTKPLSCLQSRDYQRGRSPFNERRSRRREGPAQCCHCKGYGHFAKDCPSDGLYQIGLDGLPIRVRDPSRNSSQERHPGKEKHPFKLTESRSRGPGSVPREENEITDFSEKGMN